MHPSELAASKSPSIYVGGLYTFNTSVFSSRVGISWISNQQACQDLKNEIPEGTGFSAVVQQTTDAQNTQILSKITTTITNATSLELLYMSLYFMNLLPKINHERRISERYYSITVVRIRLRYNLQSRAYEILL
jgi:putative alpha-1,2-mannosidase